MLNDVDIGFLESAFTHLEMATFLVEKMDDALIADELAKPLAEISRRTAELLDELYGPHAASAGEPDGPHAATEPTGDGKSEELEFERLLDELRDSVARADAFSRAVEHLVRETSGKDDRDNRQLARITHLVEAIADAIRGADDVGHFLTVRSARRRRSMPACPDQQPGTR